MPRGVELCYLSILFILPFKLQHYAEHSLPYLVNYPDVILCEKTGIGIFKKIILIPTCPTVKIKDSLV